MPTLRRSKSLNDKISRQKNRSAAGDFVRDPRSPDVEGRTRTNVDNFQALVHLRKQTEDKARQLELAFSYATNGHNTYLRPGAGGGGAGGPSGGVELPYPSPTKSPRHPGGVGDPSDVFSFSSKPPVPIVPRRQHSAEGRSSVIRRQESSSGSPAASSSSSSSSNHQQHQQQQQQQQQQHQSRSREQRRGGGQRPMSMVEPLAGGGLFLPTQEELNRKDQVIQSLTEGQRSLNAHNQKLLSKVDELEFENNRLQELLNAANASATSSAGSGHHTSGTGAGTSGIYSQAQHPFPGARPPHRSISFHGGDALKVSSSPHAAAHHHHHHQLPGNNNNSNSNNSHHYHHHQYGLASPHSETSVSGYGSLVDSPSGEGFATTATATGLDSRAVVGDGGVGVGPPPAAAKTGTVGGGVDVGEEEDDDTMPLSGVSECSLEYGHDTLEKTASSSAGSTTSSSRAATLNSDRSEGLDTNSGSGKTKAKKNGRGGRSGAGLHRYRSQEEEGEGEEGGNARIEELAKQVAELSSQRDTVILRYKQLLDDSLRVLKRDKRVQEELCSLVERHGSSLQGDLQSQLHSLQHQIRDPAEDVEVEVQKVLCALDPCGSAPSPTGEPVTSTMEPRVCSTLDKLVDLIGPDYQRLGRRLTVPQSVLDAVEKGAQQNNGNNATSTSTSSCRAHKTQAVLRAWLKRRGGAGGGGGGDEVPPASRHLAPALRDVDKDLRHCQQTTVSGPERRALRNCLQLAVDHVSDPRDVLDHLIALNELSPAGIAFVQEVLEKRERAVRRLWHVAEYRGTGMVSRLALALDRSHYNQLAHRLRDELEIQNSRLHTQSHSPTQELPPLASPPAPVSTPTSAPSLESGPSASQARSRPASRVPRLRSKTFDSVSPPVKSPPAPEGRVSAVRKDRPPPLRPLSMVTTRESAPALQKERPVSAVLKERPVSAVMKDRAAPAAATEEKKMPPSKNGSRLTSQPEKRRILPVPRERSFSPFPKNKSNSSQSKEKPAAHMPKERPLSTLVKDGDKPDSKNDRLVIYSHRPFSPLEKDKSPRPFSPLEKDKSPRPFSPLEKEKNPRPFSPENNNKAVRCASPFDRQKSSAAPAQQGRSSGLPMQRERPFSPFQKDRAATSYQERAVSNAQRERMNNASLHGEKRSSTPVDGRPAPQPPKDAQSIWDKRSSASSHVGATTTASGSRNSVILEQGGKISRV